MPASSRVVFYPVGETLYAIEAATGEQLWQRSDMPENGWLSADDEHVVMLSPGRTHSRGGQYKRAIVMDALTGMQVNSVDLDAYNDHTLWHTMGTKLVFSGRDHTVQTLIQFDLLTEATTWERSWPRNTIGNFRDPSTMVIATTGGQLEYLDLHDGKSLFEIQLDENRHRSMQVLSLNGHDLILFSRDNRSPNSQRAPRFNARIRVVGGSPHTLFNGTVYCVDHESQRMAWQHPLRLEFFSIPLNQPHDLPLMTFIREVDGEARSRRPDAEFYTVDLRDGRLANVSRQSRLNFRMHGLVADPLEQTVKFDFGEKQLTLQLTDEEVPPAAPANLTNRFTLGGRQVASGERPAENVDAQQQEVINRLRQRNPNPRIRRVFPPGNVQPPDNNNDKDDN